MASELFYFLDNPINSVSREALITKKVLYDLELALAINGTPLHVFVPQVDREGFDVILDDGTWMRRIQLKTVLLSSTTASWKVHPRLLRPDLASAYRLGYELSPAGTGYEGGLLVIECDVKETSIDVHYYYTDVFLLTLFELGIISSGSRLQNACENLRLRLMKSPNKKTSIPRKALLTPKSPEHLLALMGFQSRYSITPYWQIFEIAESHFRHEIPEERLSMPLPKLKQHVAKCIIALVEDFLSPYDEKK